MITSSRGGLGGKATTMFKHSCHFSPGGSNPIEYGIYKTHDYISNGTIAERSRVSRI